ncbi:hypothetical protein [Pseudomonas sp. LD120]|uniref:hypothetical protein n=1 Tax=Pseudomonas sp. LD120 TaxID=485751 RepID=UPI00135C5CD4|nr:hypothetical protein [Pseudomonas sp. LD120]KAF0864941.1 hypothetical protein PLD_06510 [Pseudomonas sp. LD120]
MNNPLAARKDGVALQGSVMGAWCVGGFSGGGVIKPFERGQVARSCGGKRDVNLKVGAP